MIILDIKQIKEINQNKILRRENAKDFTDSEECCIYFDRTSCRYFNHRDIGFPAASRTQQGENARQKRHLYQPAEADRILFRVLRIRLQQLFSLQESVQRLQCRQRNFMGDSAYAIQQFKQNCLRDQQSASRGKHLYLPSRREPGDQQRGLRAQYKIIRRGPENRRQPVPMQSVKYPGTIQILCHCRFMV